MKLLYGAAFVGMTARILIILIIGIIFRFSASRPTVFVSYFCHPVLIRLLRRQSISYVSSTPAFASSSCICKAFSADGGHFSVIDRTENSLLTLAYCFAAYSDAHSSVTLGYSEIYPQQVVFIGPLPNGVLADLDNTDVYDVNG